MDKSAAGSYIYAKASGLLGKSFVGSKANELFEARSLSDLWSLIFKTTPPSVPEILLAESIEKEAFKQFLNQYTTFVSLYDEPNRILIDQLFIYEAENLKEIGSALCSGEVDKPDLIDLGKFGQLNYKAWPNVAAITKGSPYAWYNHIPEIHEQQQMEFKIDLQVIQHLWKVLQETKNEDLETLKKLYLNEYCVKNIVWALRLKLNYKWDNDRIIKNLIYVTDAPNGADPIAAPAIQILEKDVDNYAHWEDWKYSELVNPHVGGEVWRIDPTWIERKNRVRMSRLAKQVFHEHPMTTSSLIGWYKIKNFELSCIRTAVESLRMGINSQDAKNAVGIGE